MKARNILIVIGVVMILLNLLAYSGDSFDPPEDRENRIGYLIGWNIFNIVAAKNVASMIKKNPVAIMPTIKGYFHAKRSTKNKT